MNTTKEEAKKEDLGAVFKIYCCVYVYGSLRNS